MDEKIPFKENVDINENTIQKLLRQLIYSEGKIEERDDVIRGLAVILYNTRVDLYKLVNKLGKFFGIDLSEKDTDIDGEVEDVPEDMDLGGFYS